MELSYQLKTKILHHVWTGNWNNPPKQIIETRILKALVGHPTANSHDPPSLRQDLILPEVIQFDMQISKSLDCIKVVFQKIEGEQYTMTVCYMVLQVFCLNYGLEQASIISSSEYEFPVYKSIYHGFECCPIRFLTYPFAGLWTVILNTFGARLGDPNLSIAVFPSVSPLTMWHHHGIPWA